MAKAFRFAAQATPGDGEQWLGTARRAEELGYSTLLMPDGLQLLSSMPARALAAGATTTLRVGNFAGPLASRDEYRALADDVRALAADRADDLEFVVPVFIVGDEAPRGHCDSWAPTWPR